KQRMGDHCLYYTVDRGVSGGEPGSTPTYLAMCHVFCDSMESFQQGFGPHAAEILGDIAHYTDLQPVMQISDVVVGKS
ncbi:MAG: EthD family reductase, partial [Pseudoxanthomonas sp.]